MCFVQVWEVEMDSGKPTCVLHVIVCNVRITIISANLLTNRYFTQ